MALSTRERAQAELSSEAVLTSACAAGDATIVVSGITNFPAKAKFRLRIDDEIVIVTADPASTTLTVTRGAEGSAAASHAIGTVVAHVWTPQAVRQTVRDEVLQPEHLGMLAVTFDPAATGGTSPAPSINIVYVMKVGVSDVATLTNVAWCPGVSGITGVAGLHMGVYSIDSPTVATRIGDTGDISATANGGTKSWKESPLSGGPFTFSGGVDTGLYIAVVVTTVSTLVFPRGAIGDVVIGNGLSNPKRFGSVAGSTLPATFDPSALGTGQPWCFGLS